MAKQNNYKEWTLFDDSKTYITASVIEIDSQDFISISKYNKSNTADLSKIKLNNKLLLEPQSFRNLIAAGADILNEVGETNALRNIGLYLYLIHSHYS